MDIVCPECGHTRRLAEDKIPATATLATCPKCKTKFRFRELPEPSFYHTPPSFNEEPVRRPPAPEPAAPVRTAPKLPERRDIASIYEAQAEALELERPVQPEHLPSPAISAPSVPADADTRGEEDADGGFPAEAPKLEELLNRYDLPQPEPISPEEYRRELASKPRHPLAGAAGRAAAETRPVQSKQDKKDGGAKGDIWQTLESWEEHHQVPADDDRPQETREVDWESPGQAGPAVGFLRTIKQVLLNPVGFFSTMPLDRGWTKPLVFYLIISELQAVAYFMHDITGINASVLGRNALNFGMGGAAGVGSFLALVLFPLFFTASLFIMVVLYHLMLMLIRADSGGLQGTFRAVAYAHAPFILALVPVIGTPIGWFWTLIATFFAFKCVHRAPYWKVSAAFFGPLALMLGLLWFLAQSGSIS